MEIDPKHNNILIVDDDEFIRDMLTTRLELRGYPVTNAENGLEALQLHQKMRFDLILLDIMMPEINGIDVLKQLKADKDNTPVIVMSALHEVSHVVECIQLGAEDYLTKPIESELLWARIKTSLEKKYFRDLQQTWLDDLNLLQQIDKELKTTLNRKEVARLALHWVTQKTKAAASLLGSVDGNLLKLWATHGVDKQIEQPYSLFDIGITKYVDEIVQEPVAGYGRLHPDARHRTIIPLLRNSIIHDILVVDTLEPVSASTIRFLKRLSSHIAIALHNAQLYADAKAANEAKTNFVAMVSHELKNPLTAIQSYTYLLRNQLTNLTVEQQQEYLSVVFEGSKRIHQLALELDDITQMETGQFRLVIEDVSFKETLLGVAKLLETQIAEKKQTLSLNLPETLPLVRADAKRLSQILTNLISNACKYTLESGTIQVSARRVTNGSAAILYVAVKDSGIGIAPEDQEKIFSQFFRADDENVKNVSGTGLGLNINKKLVELQGGKIDFTSIYGKGSTFFFTIPISEQETAVNPTQTDPQAQESLMACH